MLALVVGQQHNAAVADSDQPVACSSDRQQNAVLGAPQRLVGIGCCCKEEQA
jgi:hypothetical protein